MWDDFEMGGWGGVGGGVDIPLRISGTAIFTSFLFVIRLDLYLNDGKLFGV